MILVRDSAGRTFSTPTVPPHLEHPSLFAIPELRNDLQPDARFRGEIRWYGKPIVFGSDAAIGENMKWISLEQDAQLVLWWNDLYRSVKNRSQVTPQG